MRENIYESLRIRDKTDKELAEFLVQKEAKINSNNAKINNKPYEPSNTKALNIHESPTRAVGSLNLISMHKAG